MEPNSCIEHLCRASVHDALNMSSIIICCVRDSPREKYMSFIEIIARAQIVSPENNVLKLVFLSANLHYIRDFN
jgi:hypothetical protein